MLLEALEGMGGYKLFLHKQAIAPLEKPEEAIAYELLLRIDDGTEIHCAADFLKGVEQDISLQRKIDVWVIEQAAELLKVTSDRYTINVFDSSLSWPYFFSWAKFKLADLAVQDRLWIEIPETIQAEQIQLAVLNRLADYFILVLDDLGHATLNQLMKLKTIKGFKIDGGLIQNLERCRKNDPLCRAAIIVRGLFEMAASLNLLVICEHVSSEEIWSQLKDIHADVEECYGPLKMYVQGYWVDELANS